MIFQYEVLDYPSAGDATWRPVVGEIVRLPDALRRDVDLRTAPCGSFPHNAPEGVYQITRVKTERRKGMSCGGWPVVVPADIYEVEARLVGSAEEARAYYRRLRADDRLLRQWNTLTRYGANHYRDHYRPKFWAEPPKAAVFLFSEKTVNELRELARTIDGLSSNATRPYAGALLFALQDAAKSVARDLTA